MKWLGRKWQLLRGYWSYESLVTRVSNSVFNRMYGLKEHDHQFRTTQNTDYGTPEAIISKIGHLEADRDWCRGHIKNLTSRVEELEGLRR